MSLRRKIYFRIGLVLLVANVPIGYGGMAAGAVFSGITRKPIGLAFGAACYALSWAMMALGLVMAGPEGSRYAKHYWRRRLHKRRLARRLRGGGGG